MAGTPTTVKGRRCEFKCQSWLKGRSLAMFVMTADGICAEHNIDIDADTPDAVFERFADILYERACRLGIRVIRTSIEKAEKTH